MRTVVGAVLNFNEVTISCNTFILAKTSLRSPPYRDHSSRAAHSCSAPFKKKMGPSLTVEQVASAQIEGDYAIKSEDVTPKLDTSQWPLLLKNYDKLIVRSGHFTPIPSGSSPLGRDISTYIKYARSIGHFHHTFIFRISI
jgi:hypothetical protein